MRRVWVVFGLAMLLILLAWTPHALAGKPNANDHMVMPLQKQPSTCHVWDPWLTQWTFSNSVWHDTRRMGQKVYMWIVHVLTVMWTHMLRAKDRLCHDYVHIPLCRYMYVATSPQVPLANDPILLSLHALERNKQIRAHVLTLDLPRQALALQTRDSLHDLMHHARRHTISWIRQVHTQCRADSSVRACRFTRQDYQHQVQARVLHRFHTIVSCWRGTPLYELYQDLVHETLGLVRDAIEKNGFFDDPTTLARYPLTKAIDLWTAAAEQLTNTTLRRRSPSLVQRYKDLIVSFCSTLRMILYWFLSFLQP